MVPFRSIVQPNRSGSLHIELRKIASRGIYNARDALHDDLRNSRLSTRGWAYQEKVLSPRRMLFGEWNIHYLCSQSHQTLNGLEADGSYDRSVDKIKQELSKGNYHDTWQAIFPRAATFGNHSFTYPEDILPALSGLARLIQKNPCDTYLAGHWAQDLFRTLAWQGSLRTTSPKEAHFLNMFGPGPYTVPSWSILSKGYVELVIEYHFNFIGIRSEMQSCVGQVALVGTDQFGAIKNAHLQIKSHSFQNYPEGAQSIAIREVQYTIWRNMWSIVIDWSNRRFHSIVYLDYHLRPSDINQDPRMWRWALLGSTQILTQDEMRTATTEETDSQSSQSECQMVRKASASVCGDVSGYGQDPESGFSKVMIPCQRGDVEDSCISEIEEAMDLNHVEHSRQREIDRSDGQRSYNFAGAWEAQNMDSIVSSSDGQRERYPYGLVLLQIPDRREWYRVGVFAPNVWQFQEERKHHPEIKLMTLGIFKAMSEIETITVL